jgi:hypothetical protein
MVGGFYRILLKVVANIILYAQYAVKPVLQFSEEIELCYVENKFYAHVLKIISSFLICSFWREFSLPLVCTAQASTPSTQKYTIMT